MEDKMETDKEEEIDKEMRKRMPLARGVLDYFPDALRAVAEVSFIGSAQHHPGTGVWWERGKSDDHPDALMRHLLDRGKIDTDGCLHSAKVAWRALALLQLEIEGVNTIPSPELSCSPKSSGSTKST